MIYFPSVNDFRDCLMSEISRAWTMAVSPVPNPISTEPNIISEFIPVLNPVIRKIWENAIIPFKINGILWLLIS